MKIKTKPKFDKKKGDNVLKRPKVAKKMKPSSVLKVKTLKNKDDTQGVKITKAAIIQSKKEKINNSKELDLPSKTVEQALKVLLDMHDEYRKKSKTLLLSDKDFVYLQFGLMKVPEVPEQRRRYVKLHHGIFGEDPEVCLFVNDWKARDHVRRTPDEKIEYTVDYYQQFLKTHQIEGITAVIPLYQLRTEYDSYELRRKLVDRFDLFLCQSSLLDDGKFLKNLGIAFNKKNKVPLSLKFPKDPKKLDVKFRDRVSSLLQTSWYVLKPHSDTLSLRAGTVGHSAEQLRENVVNILHQLTVGEDSIPGGVANIKSIMLKTSRSKAIPLYINLASSNIVPVPVLKSIRPIFDANAGELSTMPGKKVSVLPTGDVFVTDDTDEELLPGWDSEEEKDDDIVEENEQEIERNSSEDDEVDKRNRKNTMQKKKKGKKTQKIEEPEGDMSEDSDGEVEAAEQQYLTSWNKEADEDDDNESEDGEEIETKKRGKGKNSGKSGKKKVPASQKLKEGKRKNQEPNKAAKRKKPRNN